MAYSVPEEGAGLWRLRRETQGRGEIIRPPHPIAGQRVCFRRGEWGVYTLRPPRQELYSPCPFIHPALEGHLQWACIKFGPVPAKIRRTPQEFECHRSCAGVGITVTMRGKGALISEPRFSTPCDMRFSHATKGNGHLEVNPLKMTIFPVSRGKKSHVAGGIVALCSATPATVVATPPCSATPFSDPNSGATPPGTGGARCDT